MNAATLTKQLESKMPPVVIDVRTGMEYRSGHIPGALNLPTVSLPFKRNLLPRERQTLLVITCEHGPRAVLAKGVLDLLGYKNSELLEGHMHGYRKQGFPLEK